MHRMSAEESKILSNFTFYTLNSKMCIRDRDKVIDAVKSGDIKHFFLVGGCDGARVGRNYRCV